MDTGPLLAAADRSELEHRGCSQLIELSAEDVIVPSPVLVEFDYWLRTRRLFGVFETFLNDVQSGAITIVELEPVDYVRVREILTQYADSDIGFVDAAVLAIVERLNEPKLATLDHRHFRMLRPRHVAVLELLP